MGVVYRHEEKFLLRYPQYVELKQLLTPLMHRDLNAGADGSYTVRSLYFDRADNRDYHEKVNGVDRRQKLRMRIYGETPDKVKLEIKKRRDDGIYKETVTISRAEAERLLHSLPECEFLREHQTEAASHAYALLRSEGYRPAVIIDYDREAFTLPFYKIRVTFDRRVRAARRIEEFMIPQCGMIPVLPADEIILEVKYNHMLPDFLRRALSSVPAQSMAVSKYQLSRELLG